MNKTIKSRKGATLSELVIVLAVLVIASGMVVTFSSMMHGAQGVSNERHEALQDVVTAETLIEGFIENNTREGYFVEWDVSKESMDTISFYDYSDSNNPSANFVKLSNMGAFVMTGKDVIFFEHIKSIDFKVVCENFDENEGKNEKWFFADEGVISKIRYKSNHYDILYYCTITYEVADTEYTYTFCVNPYVGEGVK